MPPINPPTTTQQIRQPPVSNPRQPGPPYPDNSRFFKGALISLLANTTQAQVTVPFQYNPHTLRRRLRPNEVGSAEGDRSQAVRFTGAAVETISIEIYLDAVDAMNQSDTSVANTYGIHPLLAALELFLYPTTTQVQNYYSQANQGSIDVVPPLAPQLVFVWGPNRVLPVRLSSMAVTEEMFDGSLNPIAATAALEMRVLTYSDVFSGTSSYTLFMSHQQNLEKMAGWVSSEIRQKDMNTLLGVDVSDVEETAAPAQQTTDII